MPVATACVPFTTTEACVYRCLPPWLRSHAPQAPRV